MFGVRRMPGFRYASLASGLALHGLATVAASAAPLTPPIVHAGLSEPVKAWSKAMEAGDLAALTRMHDADTIGFPPRGLTIKGGDAIMKGYAETFASYRADVSFEQAHYVEQAPLVVSWGLFTLTLHPKAGGADIVTRGRFTDAAVKVDGGWRYLVDHASVPAGR